MIKKKIGLATIIMGMSLSFLVGCGGASSEGGKEESSQENAAQVGLLTTDAGVVLEEVGSFPDSDFSFINNYIRQETENGDVLYDYLGRSLGEQYFNVSKFNQDYYLLDGVQGEKPVANLMTAEGEKIFAEDIEGMISRVNDVYAAVLFATGTTDNMDEALFYTTTNNMAILNGPSSGDTFYTGYVQLYNLEKREFLADVTLSNTYMDAVGASVLTLFEDGSFVLFDRDGNKVWDEFDETYYYDGCYFSREADGQVEICDETMNLLFTLPEGYELYEGNNYSKNFVVIRNNMEVWLYDREGDLAFEEPLYSFGAGNDNYCLIQTEEGEFDYHLFYYPTKFCSEELYDGVDVSSDIAFAYLGGAYTMYVGEEKRPLNGIMTPDIDNFIFTKEGESDSSKFHYYVMQDKDFTVSGGYSSGLSDALISLRSDNGWFEGLFELVTGKQLFDYVYDDFEVAYGYLYAKKDGTYTVYKINSPFGTE